MKTITIIRNMNTLNMFQRKGLIKFCNDTGTKKELLYSNKKSTCYYIDSAKTFNYKGKQYSEKYFSGCFFPYLISVSE